MLIASELGLQLETVRRWCLRSDAVESATAILPVEIVDEARGSLSIVSPSGVRGEGAALAEVIAVLRAVE